MEELKSCPFCGSPAELTHTKTWDYYVRCTNKACAARTRQYHENDVGAVSAWNARAERTCHVAGVVRYDYEGGYAGTEYKHTLSCGHRVTWGNDDAPDYCPWCGARVEVE